MLTNLLRTVSSDLHDFKSAWSTSFAQSAGSEVHDIHSDSMATSPTGSGLESVHSASSVPTSPMAPAAPTTPTTDRRAHLSRPSAPLARTTSAPVGVLRRRKSADCTDYKMRVEGQTMDAYEYCDLIRSL